ncbi:MAG: hypothetical protein ACI38Q_02460 [Candidatus Bruticola sp.]
MFRKVTTFAAVVGIWGSVLAPAWAEGSSCVPPLCPKSSFRTALCNYHVVSDAEFLEADFIPSCAASTHWLVSEKYKAEPAEYFNGSHSGIFLSRQDREKDDSKFPEAKQVKEKYRPQMLQLETSIKELRVRIAKELSSANPNKASVKSYMNQISELQRRRQQLFADQMFETLEMLPKEKRSDYLEPIIERYLR